MAPELMAPQLMTPPRDHQGQVAMFEEFWNVDGDGTITAQIGRCRVSIVTTRGMPRFLVYDGACSARPQWPNTLLASGMADTLAATMQAAEACARRCNALSVTPVPFRVGH